MAEKESSSGMDDSNNDSGQNKSFSQTPDRWMPKMVAASSEQPSGRHAERCADHP